MAKLPEIIDPFQDPEAVPTNAMFYGASGSGKTGLAATGPNVLIMDFEHGAPTTVRAVGNRSTKVVQIRDMKEVRQYYAYLLNEEHPYDTVVLDPLGDLQDLLKEEVIKKYPAKRAFNRVPSQQDWGLMTEDFRKLLNAFRALPLHTVFIAHADTRHDDEDMVKPLLQGKHMLSYAMRTMDLLGYTYVEAEDEEPVRMLLTQSTATITAKNRGNKLPTVIERPNLTEIFRIMESVDEVDSSEEEEEKSAKADKKKRRKKRREKEDRAIGGADKELGDPELGMEESEEADEE